MIELRPEPLSAEAFRPFGDVIEAGDAYELINNGTTQKFADVAQIDVASDGGRPCVSIYRSTPYNFPLRIRMLERHPLGTQLFMPLCRGSFLVVVAPMGDPVDTQCVRAFLATGNQGINYRRAVWHHPLIALRTTSEFLVIDRAGQGANCDVLTLGPEELILQSDSPL